MCDASAAAPARLSILIVGWNVRDDVRECLKSVLASPPSCSFEIIYVDNASADSSADVVSDVCPSATIVRNRSNTGFQRANNQGIALARSEYIVLLNPDTRVLDGSLDRLMHFLDAHPAAGAASPRCEYPDGRVQWSAASFPTLPIMWYWCCATHPVLQLLVGLPQIDFVHPDPARTQRQDYAYGACCMVRRAAAADAGPMDERFFLAGGDIAWSCEMKKRGWDIFYVADARIIHRESTSRNRVPRTAHLDWIRAHRRLLYRYQGLGDGLAGDAVFACHFLLLAGERTSGWVRARWRARLWAWLRALRREG